MGEHVEDTLTSMDISTADWKKYQMVIDKSDAIFQVQKNIIFDPARFNRHSQEESNGMAESALVKSSNQKSLPMTDDTESKTWLPS